MTDDPFLQLVCDALGLMNRAILPPTPSPSLLAAEFYHQYRKLWDRAIPVKLGLGHLVVRDEPGAIALVRMGEHGKQDEPFAVIRFTTLDQTPTATTYRYSITVVVGTPSTPAPPGVTVIAFDPVRWTATVTGT